MRWIKHLSNSQDDEILSELITEFGAEGYGIWWIILEKIAAQIEQNPSTKVRYSAKKWANFCEVSVQKFRKVVCLLEKKMPFFAISDDGKYIQVDCPNILKYCDNWTLRRLKKPTENTKSLCSNSVVNRGNPSHEVEVEVEVEVESKKKVKRKKHKYSSNFLCFWNAYPKKKNIASAEKAFLKLKPDKDFLNEILLKLEQAKKSYDWQKDGGQYIPHPATWFNARGWEDEIVEGGIAQGLGFVPRWDQDPDLDNK